MLLLLLLLLRLLLRLLLQLLEVLLLLMLPSHRLKSAWENMQKKAIEEKEGEKAAATKRGRPKKAGATTEAKPAVEGMNASQVKRSESFITTVWLRTWLVDVRAGSCG